MKIPSVEFEWLGNGLPVENKSLWPGLYSRAI